MIGIVVVRDGRLGPGSHEVASCSEETWLIGRGLETLEGAPRGATRALEVGAFAPAAWTRLLVGELGDASVVLSSEPDGRDLAGRLAAARGAALFAGCLEVRAERVVCPRFGGATTVVVRPPDRFVATVQPRGTSVGPTGTMPELERFTLDVSGDATVVATLAPDLETLDLADASRILAGGAGLEDETAFTRLAALAPQLGAAMGATRVITDRGWVPFRRQIGTTGVTVAPALYVAFGISGAVQHTSGLGTPEHVVSINTDAACPMSQMADLAIVADATATLDALVATLRSES